MRFKVSIYDQTGALWATMECYEEWFLIRSWSEGLGSMPENHYETWERRDSPDQPWQKYQPRF